MSRRAAQASSAPEPHGARGPDREVSNPENMSMYASAICGSVVLIALELETKKKKKKDEDCCIHAPLFDDHMTVCTRRNAGDFSVDASCFFLWPINASCCYHDADLVSSRKEKKKKNRD